MKQRGCIIGFFTISVLVLAVALSLRWFMPGKPDPWGEKPRPRVVVTIPPLSCFVQNVAGPNVALACLCTGQGPEVYEPTDDDAALLQRADLFLASGLDVDDRLADALHENARSVRFRKISEALPAGLGSNEGDPRVWLGLSRAVVLVQRVRDELKAVDPGRAADYDKNADRYVAQLRELEQEGKKQIEKNWKDRRIVSLQGPLRLFAESFGLDVVATYRLGANEGPGSKQLQEVVDRCVASGGPRVLAAAPEFARSATAKNLADALSKQKVQAVLVGVDPLETAAKAELANPGWFIGKMAGNLARLLKYLP